MLRRCLAAIVVASGVSGNANAQDRTVQEILDRAIDAMGGRAALEAIEGAVYDVVSDDGSVDETHFMRGSFDHVQVRWSPIVHGHRGRVGEVAWHQRIDVKEGPAPMGNLAVEVRRADDPLIFAHTFHRFALDLLRDADRAAVVGQLNEGGVEDVEVVFTFENNRRRRVAFSGETGLPMSVTIEAGGRAPSWGYAFGEWTQQRGIVMFTRLTPLRPGAEPLRVTASFGVPPEEAFEPPAAVQLLLALKEEAAEAARRREAISRMEVDEVRAELARVSQERLGALGTPRHAALRREFRLLMDRMRELSAAKQMSMARE